MREVQEGNGFLTEIRHALEAAMDDPAHRIRRALAPPGGDTRILSLSTRWWDALDDVLHVAAHDPAHLPPSRRTNRAIKHLVDVTKDELRNARRGC